MTLPGFELLYSSIQSQLRSPADAVVSAVHWKIICSGFRCRGQGENPRDQVNTESLPNGWNSGDIYVLHYQHTKTNKNFILKIVPVEGVLLLHFQRENDENVASTELQVSNFATANLSNVSSAIKDIEHLSSIVEQSLIAPSIGSSSQTARDNGQQHRKGSSTSSSSSRNKSPLLVEERRPMQPAWIGSQGMDPFAVGRNDLDPLSGMGVGGIGGGGMIMDPRYSGPPRFGPERGPPVFGPSRGGGIHPGAFPPGSVPPGARFDPIGPPGTRPDPDPDHERPPGYDDMFM